jgi:hypothetical protein
MTVFVKTHPVTVFGYLHMLVNFLPQFVSDSDSNIRFASERAHLDIMSGRWETVWSTTLQRASMVHTLASTVTGLDAEIFLPFEFCQ